MTEQTVSAMNTPAHIIVNAALLGHRRVPREWMAAALGGALPDVPMFAFYFLEKVLKRESEGEIWKHYFDPSWQHLFDVFHSIPLMGLLTWIAWRFKSSVGTVLGGSMLLHAVEDLPLHHDDAHRHFLPLSDWRFESPISYWDPQYYGHVIGPLEILLVLVCTVWIFRSHPWPGSKVITGVLLGCYAGFWFYAWTVWG